MSGFPALTEDQVQAVMAALSKHEARLIGLNTHVIRCAVSRKTMAAYRRQHNVDFARMLRELKC